jgi:hypothetical protein
LFNFAIEQGILDLTPVYHVKPPAKKKRRDRVLNAAKIRTFWERLETTPMSESIRLAVADVGHGAAQGGNSELGLAATDADVLREALLLATCTENTIADHRDAFGQRYTIDFIMTTAVGAVTVRSSWIIRAGETKPRLTSCYVR